MTEKPNKYDHLFKNMASNSMAGVKIFNAHDTYIKPQKYNDVTNLENGIWEKLFINVEPLIDLYVIKEYLLGMRTLPIPKDRFPKFDSITPLLENSTDWELVPVAGFLDEKLFFLI